MSGTRSIEYCSWTIIEMDKVVDFLVESIEGDWVCIKSNQGRQVQVAVTQVTRQNGSIVARSELRAGLRVAVSLSSSGGVQKVVLGPVPSTSGPFAKPVGPAQMPVLPAKQAKPETPNYANLRKEFALATLNYSKRIYPIKLLKEDFAYHPAKQIAVRLIKRKCVGVRKCNAGDINGFWKALSVGYLELLACDCTPLTYLSRYVSLVKGRRGEGKLLSTLQDLERNRLMGRSMQQWLAVTSLLSPSLDSSLPSLDSSPLSPNTQLSQSLPSLPTSTSSDTQFWQEQVCFLRDFVISFLSGLTPSLSGQQTVAISGLDPATIRLMTEMDRENGALSDINFHGAAQALDLRLILMTTELKRVKERYEPEESSANVLFLYLFRDNLVFHLLYTQEQLTSMGYNIEKGSWEPNRPGAKALFARRKSRGKVASSLETRVSALTSQLSDRVQSLRLLQPLIKDITRIDLSAGLRSNLQQEMAAPALQLLNEAHWAKNLTSSIVSEDTEKQQTLLKAWEAVNLQRVFKDAGFFHRPGCVESSEHSGALVSLGCEHKLCTDCAGRFIYGESGAFTEEALCPFCGVSFAVSKEYAVISENPQKLCWKCNYYRPIAYFPVSFCTNCDSDMCLFCYSCLFTLNSQLCECGEPFRDFPHGQTFQQTIVTCKSCKVCKSILDFAHVECDGHRLCKQCWTGRQVCPLCQRGLDAVEISLLASN